uniref:Uncharacterized protein n=1 Tax=Arundo donax TaxID=35708 RepID=A0A0A9A7R7_ARUDO
MNLRYHNLSMEHHFLLFDKRTMFLEFFSMTQSVIMLL